MKLLWIAAVWPEPESSAAGVRTAQLLAVMKDAGFSITVSSPCGDNPYRSRLEASGISTVSFLPNDSAFNTFVAELHPEVVVFDRFMIEEQFSFRVRESAPNALRVLDTVDLHHLRRDREAQARSKPTESTNTLRELASLYRSDLTIVISDYEREYLNERFQIAAPFLTLARIAYDSPSSPRAFTERRDFVWIGNFNHPPNEDSVRFLKESIWPAIRTQLPSAELHLFGSYEKESLKRLHDAKTGFHLRGWCENARETLGRYRVLLAPLRFGAGIKGKISDSWSVGTPVVTTPFGAEGMAEDLSFGGSQVDSVEAFVTAAVELHEQSDLWENASNHGLTLIRTLYSPETYAHLPELFRALRGDLSNHRSRNFIGELLWYQQFRSTEYFSRWIEAKNQTS